MDESLAALEGERAGIQKDLLRAQGDIRKLVATAGNEVLVAGRLADLQEQLQQGEQRLTAIRDEVARLQSERIDECDVAESLRQFDPVWESLSVKEQARVLRLLVERVDFDGDKGNVTVTFHPTGIKALGNQLAGETAA